MSAMRLARRNARHSWNTSAALSAASARSWWTRAAAYSAMSVHATLAAYSPNSGVDSAMSRRTAAYWTARARSRQAASRQTAYSGPAANAAKRSPRLRADM